MRSIMRKKGQSTLEFCVLTVGCVLALVAMSGYMIRAMQGAFKEQADELGAQYAPGVTEGYTLETYSSDASVGQKLYNHTDFADEMGIHSSEVIDGSLYLLEKERINKETTTKMVYEEHPAF